jgi:hypothetical protein
MRARSPSAGLATVVLIMGVACRAAPPVQAARAAAAVQASPAAVTCRPWKFHPPPTLASSIFSAVSGVASNDVWAVGTNGGLAPLIEHWDGTTWTDAPQPLPSGDLFGVAAIATNDVWAVGYESIDVALIEHWDGSSWSVVPSPQPGASQNQLTAVAAVSSTDIWAAGRYSAPNGSIQPLYEHWNGSAWSQVKPPSQTKTRGGVIQGLGTIASNDVWAVGLSSAGGFNTAPLAEHWDGGQWRFVPTASMSTGVNQFKAVYGAATDDVWAVGTTLDGGFTQHWDGVHWQLTQSSADLLWGVSGTAANDVWAVGFSSGPNPYSEHWDRSVWADTPTPNPDQSTQLVAVDALSSTDIWAVGSYFPPSSGTPSPAALHSAGICG